MTVLYVNPCYNEVCYRGTELYVIVDKHVLSYAIYYCM